MVLHHGQSGTQTLVGIEQDLIASLIKDNVWATDEECDCNKDFASLPKLVTNDKQWFLAWFKDKSTCNQGLDSWSGQVSLDKSASSML